MICHLLFLLFVLLAHFSPSLWFMAPLKIYLVKRELNIYIIYIIFYIIVLRIFIIFLTFPEFLDVNFQEKVLIYLKLS